MNNLTKTIALTLVLALAACSKDKAKEGGGGGGTAKTTEPAGPLKMSTKELWDDYAKQDGAALLTRYEKGVEVTGTIKTVFGDPADTSAPIKLGLDVDGTKFISISYKDDGVSVRDKKAGDTVTATCEVLGQSGNMMQLDECMPK